MTNKGSESPRKESTKVKKDAAGIARALSRKLKAAGFSRGDYGKYNYFSPAENQVAGYIVKRVGCSDVVRLSWFIPGALHNKVLREAEKEKTSDIIAAAKSMGYGFDDKGYLRLS